MSNLFAALSSAGSALDIYQQALDTVQNNITNTSTPGYARQKVVLEAQPFDLAGGLAGGVATMGLESARDHYADESVRRQVQSLGQYKAQTQGTEAIQSLFDVTGDAGISADLSALFQSFSAWSVNPGSAASRQSVIAEAGDLATGVRRMADALSRQSTNIETQINTTVEQINQLATTISAANFQRTKSRAPDPGLDANRAAALEQLAELVDISTVNQADGTVTVLLSGGAPLVVGQQQYDLAATLVVPPGAVNPQAPPSSRILDSQGHDVTSQVQGGKLGGLLYVRNDVLPSLTGDSQQAGALNLFAKALADTVNGILQSGTVSPAPGASAGADLFVYDASDATAAARTFGVNSNLTAQDLAPVDSLGNANGNAIQLAALASSAVAALGNVSFGDFFSGVASAVGRETATAHDNESSQKQVVAQTRSLRDQSSGVSLDEQAIMLLEFQKNYQATARLLTTLNAIADTTMTLIR